MAKKQARKRKSSNKAVKKKTAPQPSPTQEKPYSPEFSIVGIGASAGGLAALKRFFSQVPDDSGLSYVVVVHLSPEHESHLSELLQPHVKMPVEQVQETVKLKPNHVYVIPPNANLNTIDTHLRLSELEERRQERAPIDHFFRTLANTHDGHAIGVILTGTGSDGTLGLREIKEKAGLVIVQDPNEAEYDGMPQSAIATGLVDLILPIEKIPAAILKFVQTKPQVAVAESDEETDGQTRQILHKIFAQLRARTGRDFSRYKRSTIMRRITRRMQFNHIEKFPKYLEFLRDQPDEVRELADDLLITVTNFFRDPEVFKKLASEVIPQLFEEKGPQESIRVWTVGCATGEEAYSLAILLLEEADRRDATIPLQVFASDLHEHSLDKARDGFYPGDIEADVSPARLKRYFEKVDNGYRIRKEVREMVVFTPHNLLADPPFSRLDLISCRNLMIYLQRDVQKEVIELFHYALKPDGYLVLGTSETLDSTDLFRLEDKKSCIHRKRNVPGPEPRLPVFPLVRTHLPQGAAHSESPAEPISYGLLHQRTVEQHAPPSLLVSPDDQVMHLSAHVGRYLVHPGGEITSNIYKLVREELRIELRAILHAVRGRKLPASSKPILVKFNGEKTPVVLHVRPSLEPQHEGFALVIFDERPGENSAPALSLNMASPIASAPPDANVQEMEAELNLAHQRLQAIIEEYETSQEELKASNEEMQSANEELRSTLEELETSKEELQSMNEELQTVNQENRHKVEELAQLSGDLQNLLAATDIATLFLDRDMRIMRFTPKVNELFNVRMTDRGRPLSDITHRLGYQELQKDAKRVLDKLIPIERELEDEEGCWYLTRILPYRSSEDRIEGIVITFVDITERRQAESDRRRQEELLRQAAEAARFGSYSYDIENESLEWSKELYTIRGLPVGTKITRQQIEQQIHPDDREKFRDFVANALKLPEGEEYEGLFRIVRPDGQVRWMADRGRILYNGRGKSRKPHCAVGMVLDVTEQKQAEEQLRQLNESLEQQVAQRTEMLRMLQDITRAANEARTIQEAMTAALARIAQYNGWQVGHVWRIAEEGTHEFVSFGTWYLADTAQLAVQRINELRQISEQTRFRAGEGFVGNVLKTGKPQWVNDIRKLKDWRRGDPKQLGLHAAIAFPVFADSQVVAVMEFFSDHPAKRDERFMEVMPDVGIQLGHVIQRKELERQIADTAEHEQRRLGNDIHDGVGQELTGLKFIASSCAESLTQKSAPEAEMAQRLAEGLETVQKHLRTIIRNLIPVDLDKQGLEAAFQALAERIRTIYQLDCQVQCPQPVLVEDNLLATHLYRIIQEAVTNAVKHAEADRITIQLSEDDLEQKLQVIDNGKGFNPDSRSNGSFGLQSMQYRADLIGAKLSIQPGESGGVIVTCRVPRREGKSVVKS